MEKTIRLDNVEYEYDEVTCFEHPIAVLFEYYKKGTGNLFIMAAKCMGVYGEASIREGLFSFLKEKFGFEISCKKFPNYREVVKYIDNNSPIIVGVNLKEIFYSTYYMEGNWTHWMLINGYRKTGNLITVYDNTQFDYIGHDHGNFNIPFNYIKLANKSFVKAYGWEYSSMTVKIIKEISMKEMVVAVLEMYIKYMSCEGIKYRQIKLLKEYEILESSKNNLRFDKVEVCKKLININKYRKLLLSGFKIYMDKYKFDEEQKNKFIKVREKLNEQWQDYILRQCVKIRTGKDINMDIGDEIKKDEKETLSYICMFRNYLINEADEIILDNKGIMLTEDKNKYTYSIMDDGIYNWWDMDDACKRIVYDNLDDDMEVSAIVKIQNGINMMGCMTGVYVRNNDSGISVMIGVGTGGEVCIDEIGITGYKFGVQVDDIKKIFIFRKGTTITMGVYVEKEIRILFEFENEENNMLEVGVVCKNWKKCKGYKAEVEIIT